MEIEKGKTETTVANSNFAENLWEGIKMPIANGFESMNTQRQKLSQYADESGSFTQGLLIWVGEGMSKQIDSAIDTVKHPLATAKAMVEGGKEWLNKADANPGFAIGAAISGAVVDRVSPELSIKGVKVRRRGGGDHAVSENLPNHQSSTIAPHESPCAILPFKQKDEYMGGYPNRPLPRDKHGNQVPESDLPHSQLGVEIGKKSKAPYKSAREFGPNGLPVRDIHFTNHGNLGGRVHPSPHQHVYEPNPTGGIMKYGEPESL